MTWYSVVPNIGILEFVTPAEAGVQKCLKILDSGLRRNDAWMRRFTAIIKLT